MTARRCQPFFLPHHRTTPNLLLRIEVLAIHRCGERTEVHKALALRDTDDDALIVTVTVRLENRIANLVHLLFPLSQRPSLHLVLLLYHKPSRASTFFLVPGLEHLRFTLGEIVHNDIPNIGILADFLTIVINH